MYRIRLILLSFIITGCTPDSSFSKKGDGLLKTEDETYVSPINDSNYEFTYLEELPSEKLKMYKEFLRNGSISSLSDFTPEEMVLIFMNLVFEDNLEKLYIITYDNGHLPPVEDFIEEYRSSDWEQTYLMYRFYDSISINGQSTKDTKIIQLEIVFGSKKYIRTFPMMQEDGIWKIAIYEKNIN
ncbi:hypothetical protein [Cytobacillus praedii]|uniref:hypothetical protein n=1 Tax=Cytobacillus praedii TaxID=1742358 RepID=UPI003AF8510B